MPPISIRFQAIAQDQPGEKWHALFERSGPLTARGSCAAAWSGVRPTECRRALREHMPELVPVWEQLAELAGGGDVEARFLSLWCPPAYIAGCSQTVWIDPQGRDEPALLRNYDFAPALLEGNWLATRWTGRRVAAMGDCLWGALDGVNEDGGRVPVVRRAHRRGHRLRHPAGAALRAGNRAQHRPGHRHPAARAGAHEL